MTMEAVTKLGRWVVSTVVLAGGVLAASMALRSAPQERPRPAVPAVAKPTAPPAAPTAAPPVAPTRAVPCLAKFVDLLVLDDEPAICDDATCVVPSGGTTVARPAKADDKRLPLAARIQLGDEPAACDDERCVRLGSRLAAAAKREAARNEPTLQATLDLSTAVVGSQIWSIARDARIAPRPAEQPNEEILDVQVAGDVLVVHWRGTCQRSMGVNPSCEAYRVTSARGVEIDTIQADDGLLRIGKDAFLALSASWGFAVHDLRTGKHITHTRFYTPFLAAVPLYTEQKGRFALLREIDNGRLLEDFEIEWSELFPRGQHFYPDCN